MTFEAAVQERHPKIGPAALNLIVERMRQFGISTPSATLVDRAVGDLARSGKLSIVRPADAAKAHAAQAASSPLNVDEVNYLQGFNLSEVNSHYYSNADFRALYDRGIRFHGFRAPVEPPKTDATEPDLGPYADLTPEKYYSMPANTIVQLYRGNKFFRAAVEKLIREGKI
jgi:hypothetical protein